MQQLLLGQIFHDFGQFFLKPVSAILGNFFIDIMQVFSQAFGHPGSDLLSLSLSLASDRDEHVKIGNLVIGGAGLPRATLWWWCLGGEFNAICGQSYKAFTIVIYDSRVVPDLKILHITTLES